MLGNPLLRVKAVKPGWSEGGGSLVRGHHLVQHLLGPRGVGGGVARPRVPLHSTRVTRATCSVLRVTHPIVMHVEAAVVHLRVIFALPQVKQGNIALAGLRHSARRINIAILPLLDFL